MNDVRPQKPEQVQHQPTVARQSQPDVRVESIIADLVRRKASKPRTQKSLRGTIQALFKNELAEQQIDALLGELCTRGIVKINGAKLTYSL